MKKRQIIIKGADLEKFLNQLDSTSDLENIDKEGLEGLCNVFNLRLIEKEITSLDEENLRDLVAKLHALPDEELQETLKTYPRIKELWYEHFVRWAFGEEPDPS